MDFINCCALKLEGQLEVTILKLYINLQIKILHILLNI